MEPRRKQIGALPGEVSIEVDRGEDHSVLHLHGELDLHSAGRLQDALVAEDDPARSRLVVDLGGVTFLDSAVLGVLAGALQRARAHAGTVELVCGDRRLLRLFEITRLDDAFRIHPDLDAVGMSRHRSTGQ